jgi:hypothetical protein
MLDFYSKYYCRLICLYLSTHGDQYVTNFDKVDFGLCQQQMNIMARELRKTEKNETFRVNVHTKFHRAWCALRLQACIRKVLGSNFGMHSYYPD